MDSREFLPSHVLEMNLKCRDAARNELRAQHTPSPFKASKRKEKKSCEIFASCVCGPSDRREQNFDAKEASQIDLGWSSEIILTRSKEGFEPVEN